jgi:hypothetical protein
MRELAILMVLGLARAQSSGPCGKTGLACCEDDFCSAVDAVCEGGTCSVPVPGKGVCAGKGQAGQECCFLQCQGDNLSCSEGTCVDIVNAVIDQAGPPPGTEGAPCVGQYQECDENDEFALQCVDGKCILPPQGVLDQSVRLS